MVSYHQAALLNLEERIMSDLKAKSIYIPIEIKHRELQSQLLLAALAAQKGYFVYVGSKKTIHQMVLKKKKNNGIFLYKGGHDLELLRKIKQKTEAYCIIDQEIGPVFNEAFFVKRLDKENQAAIDRYFAYDERVAKLASNTYPYLDKKAVVVSGWPRSDLWKNRWAHLYKHQALKIQKKYGSFFLFSSNFGFTSSDRIKKIEQEIKNEENVYFKRVYLESAKKKYQEYTLFIDWIKRFSSKNKNHKIVIRPHPAENHKAWFDDLKDIKNVDIVYEGEITPWISACRGLLHTGCTTSLQAHYMYKHVGFIQLQSSIDDNYKQSMDVSDTIKDVEQQLSWMDEVTKKNSTLKNKINADSTQEATNIIMNEFLNLEVSDEPMFKFSFYDRSKFWLKSNADFFRLYLISIRHNDGYANKLGHSIKYSEVRPFIKLINKNINVKALAKNCFLVFDKSSIN